MSLVKRLIGSIRRECLDQMLTRTELYGDAAVKAPMLYASPGFWAEYGDMTKREYWLKFPLWLAHYTTSMSPQLPSPWPMWKFWQFTAKGPGEVFGSECLTMDMDRFNGTLSELMEFAGVRIPVVNLNEMVDTLAQRTKVVEDARSNAEYMQSLLPEYRNIAALEKHRQDFDPFLPAGL